MQACATFPCRRTTAGCPVCDPKPFFPPIPSPTIVQFEIGKLDLEDGDILLVRLPQHLAEHVKSVHEVFEFAMRQARVRVPVVISPIDVEYSVVKAPDDKTPQG